MHLPIRFVVCSYNLWGQTRWAERRNALQHFTQLHRPDLLCVQEFHPSTCQLLDAVLLSTHERVRDTFAGWTCESNIYWNQQFFRLVTWGAEPVGHTEPQRRLFWVRLRLATNPAQTLLVSTVHYTWPGNASERAGGPNPRIAQAQATVAALRRLAHDQEPLLLTGDLNDQLHAVHILQESGLVDCFTALGRTPKPTWPALPTASGTPFTIDWMLHSGPLRALTADVADFYRDDSAPSDHKPVLATYAWEPERKRDANA